MSKIGLLTIVVSVVLATLFIWQFKTVFPPKDLGIYTNSEYGFTLKFPDSWKGFSVIENTWQGWKVDGSGKIGDYTGVTVVFRNPNWTEQAHWQDIPIMVFTPEVWQMIQDEKIAVSAAPIPPAEVGRNSKYIFATPPRWYGFTDDLGWQEAVEMVKTFKGI